MKVRVTEAFYDTANKSVLRKAGDELEVSDKRGEVLLNNKVVEVVESTEESEVKA